MDRREVYDSPEWGAVRERVLARDRRRCVLGWLLGGPCSGPLHVHHVEPIEERPDLAYEPDNLISACEAHHPSLEAFRRFVRARRAPRRCPHVHPTRAGREACERRLNRAAA